MDLTEVEGLADLIAADTAAQRKQVIDAFDDCMHDGCYFHAI